MLRPSTSAKYSVSVQVCTDGTVDKSTDMTFIVYSFFFNNRLPPRISGTPLWFKLSAHQSIMNGIFWLAESKGLYTFRPPPSYTSQDSASRVLNLLRGCFAMTAWMGISQSQVLRFKTTDTQKRHWHIRVCHADSNPWFQCRQETVTSVTGQ